MIWPINYKEPGFILEMPNLPIFNKLPSVSRKEALLDKYVSDLGFLLKNWTRTLAESEAFI